jgi:hypothetical protein
MAIAEQAPSFVEDPWMSMSALGCLTSAAASLRHASSPAAASGFGAQVAVALGKSHAAHAARTQETGAPASTSQASGSVGTAPARTLADDTRALVGDVFGALGAATPTAVTAQQAVAAYRRAG